MPAIPTLAPRAGIHAKSICCPDGAFSLNSCYNVADVEVCRCSTFTGRLRVAGAFLNAKTADAGSSSHYASGGRPYDVDRFLGGGARNAVRLRATEPRRPLAESYLF